MSGRGTGDRGTIRFPYAIAEEGTTQAPTAVPTFEAPETVSPATEKDRAPRWWGPSEPRATVGDVLRRPAVVSDAREERYRILSSIGRGGMGEVSRTLDAKIGREVALKAMLPVETSLEAQAKSRFLREARVQALLEHPAIVPVYDIGTDPYGMPYFTMKRIRGETLFDVIERLRSGQTTKGWAGKSRRRLLTSFVTVCLAMDYAHQRGVVHRDLKPENVMLGPSGEVYVLDWGVAKVTVAGQPMEDDLTIGDLTTKPGEMVGTPGFMSPEQVLGQHSEVDGQSDVFALGAILFEILALAPLFDLPNAPAILQATVDPGRRPPPPPLDAPPELYALAIRATSFPKEQRPATAREMAEAVERYLDGDRDAGLRKQFADEKASEARSLAWRALQGPEAEREDARGRAMRAAGQALAVAPAHPEAAAVVLELLSSPPDKTPAAVERELYALERQHARVALGKNALRTVAWIVPAAMLLAMGVRVGWLIGAMIAVLLACIFLAFWLYKRENASSRWRFVLFGLSCLLASLGSGVFGPLVFIPSFAAINVILFIAMAPPRQRPWFFVLGGASFMVPLALELLGVLPPSMRFEGDSIVLLPRLTDHPPVLSVSVLTLVSLMGIVLPATVAARLRDGLLDLERKLLLQKWQLSQLSPKVGRDSSMGLRR